ncbi:MAG: hypothetical protein M0036_21790 [Desulfobacteraceae bacterium]|nr:hypothetical protein [Desulfobacteraceae bacterium]
MSLRIKRAVAIISLIAALGLTVTGTMDRLLGWCGLDRLEKANTQYLDSAFNNALAGFLILSGIKSGLAVVTGSSVGVGVNIELGDVVQPVYDYVDTAWKAAMAGASILVVMKMALQGLSLIDHWALALLLLFWLIWCLTGWWWAKGTRWRRSLEGALRFCAALCAMLYLLLPLTISGAGLISKHITAPVVQQSQEQLKSVREALAPETLYQRFFSDGQGEEELSAFDLKGRIKRMGQEVKTLIAYFKMQTEQLAALTLKLIAAYLFDCILFPLFFGLVLMTMIKSGVRFLFELDRRGVAGD